VFSTGTLLWSISWT